MTLSLDDVRNKRFRLARKSGYEVAEVDDFLDQLQESFAQLLGRLHRERGVTTLYVSHEFGAVEGIVDRLVLVRGGIVFDGPPGSLPSEWHDPSHAHARH